MCIIIDNSSKMKVPLDIIQRAERINPDGFGITYLDGDYETITTTDYVYAEQLVTEERAFIAHYRYATVGLVNVDNCHPFSFKNKGKEYQLYSNGTVADLGDDSMTDTEEVAKILARTPRVYWDDLLSMTDVRFAICHKDEVLKYGKWHVKDGISYSKNNCFAVTRVYPSYKGYNPASNKTCSVKKASDLFDDEWNDDWDDGLSGIYGDEIYIDDYALPKVGELVAVYGTLKQGHGNHRLLDGSKALFIAEGFTDERYRMIDRGIPYVFEGESEEGHNIKVEVYSPLTEAVWKSLDNLEGHPTHYKRKKIQVISDNGNIVSAWLYFGQFEPEADAQFISEFTKSGFYGLYDGAEI